MYKRLQLNTLIQTELIDIQYSLASGITKTNNSKLRVGYLRIYEKIRNLLDQLNKSKDEPNDFLIILKNKTFEIDQNANGFSLHCSFNKDSEYSNFVNFKICMSHGK